MAEQDKEQRTEEATPKKREKAREDGRVAVSHDLILGLSLSAASLLLGLGGGTIHAAFESSTESAAAAIRNPSSSDVVVAARQVLLDLLGAVSPIFFLLLPLTAVAALAQTGLHFVPEKLRARPEKLVPAITPDKFVNGRSLIETGTSVLKLVLLAAAAWFALAEDAPRMLALEEAGLIARSGADLLLRLLMNLGLALVVIGVIDLLFKRRQLENDLRMTKEEVKQEAKDAAGDPEVKGRIRRRQREMAMRRMMDEVPKATVVIANPTHFSVALRYDPGQSAPRVVAKGKDFLALRIRETAAAAGVPIVENPPLARALYAGAEIGDEIPATLYQAVAEVLAAILRARRKLGRTA